MKQSLTCPVCGTFGSEVLGGWEEETYAAVNGHMWMGIAFCGVGPNCTRVEAANVLDRLAEPFLEAAGEL